MFREATHVVLSKADLLPYVPFDLETATSNLRQVNPEIEIFVTSALTGQGLDAWYDFLRSRVRAVSHHHPSARPV
jgi:hydrogenase nickel incorporation protein HypB